jgi:predicted metal-dependent peptidase
MSETLRSALESAFEGQLIRAKDRTDSRHWGSLPAALRSAIAQMEERRKPRIDWRRKLRIFAAGGYRTRVVPTNRRMSKRFGTFPGIRIQREQRVAVVIDTSGSIGKDQLEMFFSEIHGVWRTGAEVLVVECDAAVQRTYPYKGKTPQDVSGGGGTAFDPAFQWLRQPQNGRFDACLYLTDGYGPEPQVRPRCPVMWVVTDSSGCGPHLKWGQVVMLDELP